MVEFIVSKYKIIFALILFCFFQTSPSFSLELKIPKIGDLKKITEDIKKELEKKEPEVKKEEVKKEEVKKKEVKEINESSFINKRIEFKFRGINEYRLYEAKYCRNSRNYYFYPDNYFEAFHGCTGYYKKRDWDEIPPGRAVTTFGTWEFLKEKKPQTHILSEYEKEIYSDDENKVDIITTREILYTGDYKEERETKIRIDLKKFIGFVKEDKSTGDRDSTPIFTHVGWSVQISDIDTKDTYYYALKTKREEKEINEKEINKEGILLNKSLEIKYTGNALCKGYRVIINFYSDYTYREYTYCEGSSEPKWTSSLEKWKLNHYDGQEENQFTIILYFQEKIKYGSDAGKMKTSNYNIEVTYDTPGSEVLFTYPDGAENRDWILGDIKEIDKKNIETNVENQKKNKKAKCEKILTNAKIDQKSKTLGGLDDLYFGMLYKDFNELVNCKKKLNDKINVLISIKGENKNSVVIENLVNDHNASIFFTNKKIDIIQVDYFTQTINNKQFYLMSSGIDNFEKLKKTVLGKYKLLKEPSKSSIDLYNNLEKGELFWVFEGNLKNQLILLVLDYKPGENRFFYSGSIKYLSSEESKIYN